MPRSYTWGSPEGVQAAVNSLPERYAMTLTGDDMEALIRALVFTANSDACEGENGNDSDHVNHGAGEGRECLDGCWRMRAMSLVSTIAECLNTEWI